MTWKTTSLSDMTHAAEWGHWYDRDGASRYTVIGKNGKERPTTIRDAKENGWLPSVTGVIKCAAAPGLERWKLDQMLHAALTLPRKDAEAEADWIKRVWQDSQETAKKAAERGTAIHAAIQGFWQKETPDATYTPHIQGVCAALEDHFKLDPECAIVEQSFASPLGYGGKVDFCCTSPYFVVDFKTKEFGPDDDLKTWDEQHMQLAAYRHGMEMPQARCAIVYVSVTNPGLCRLIEINEPELTRGWRCFYSLLQYWKAVKGYESSFDRLMAA
jgi:hypothetical protein